MSRSASEAWAAATDFEYNDGAVIRWADDYAEALLLAVDAVRELHSPEPGWPEVCAECNRVALGASLYSTWPCPTWRATEGL